MIILAVDTSAAVCSAAVWRDDRVVASIELDQGKTHSTQLMPTIEAALDLAEMKLADIDCFAISIGPGSFTGLRIGIATVQGLATALDKPVIPVSSLAVLAERFSSFGTATLALMDARHQRAYAGLFSNGQLVFEEALLPLDDLTERMRQLDERPDRLIVTGDGARVARESLDFQAMLDEASVEAFYSDVSDAQSYYAARLAQRLYDEDPSVAIDPADLKPSYLTATSAEKQLGIEV